MRRALLAPLASGGLVLALAAPASAAAPITSLDAILAAKLATSGATAMSVRVDVAGVGTVFRALVGSGGQPGLDGEAAHRLHRAARPRPSAHLRHPDRLDRGRRPTRGHPRPPGRDRRRRPHPVHRRPPGAGSPAARQRHPHDHRRDPAGRHAVQPGTGRAARDDQDRRRRPRPTLGVRGQWQQLAVRQRLPEQPLDRQPASAGERARQGRDRRAGSLSVGRPDKAPRALASLASRPLSAIVHDMLKKSINFYAETLLEDIGAARGDGSQDGGVKVIGAVAARLGVRLGGNMVDGSGLSTDDRQSADGEVSWLRRSTPTGRSGTELPGRPADRVRRRHPDPPALRQPEASYTPRRGPWTVRGR